MTLDPLFGFCLAMDFQIQNIEGQRETLSASGSSWRQKDQIFARNDSPQKFSFDQSVVDVFEDMVQRSIPNYEIIQDLSLEIIGRVAHPTSPVYDLGCSHGALLRKFARLFPGFSAIGVDSSVPMVERARREVEFAEGVTIEVADISHMDFEPASAFVANYTLQFIPLDLRASLISKMFQSLMSGGVLVMSEKIHSCDEVIQNQWTKNYEAFKRNNGYSEMEIARKKQALDGVLVTRTTEENQFDLRQAGFETVEVVMQWNNFVTYVARKGVNETSPPSLIV